MPAKRKAISKKSILMLEKVTSKWRVDGETDVLSDEGLLVTQ